MKHFTKILEAVLILGLFALPVGLLWLLGSSFDLIPVRVFWTGCAVCILSVLAFSRALVFDCLTD